MMSTEVRALVDLACVTASVFNSLFTMEKLSPIDVVTSVEDMLRPQSWVSPDVAAVANKRLQFLVQEKEFMARQRQAVIEVEKQRALSERMILHHQMQVRARQNVEREAKERKVAVVDVENKLTTNKTMRPVSSRAVCRQKGTMKIPSGKERNEAHGEAHGERNEAHVF